MSNHTGRVRSTYCKYGCGRGDRHPLCRVHLSDESVVNSRENHTVSVLVLGALMAAAWTIIVMVLAPVPADGAQPYGGCKEAIDYPHSEGADWCRDHGWTVTRSIVVRPDRWVVNYRMPLCEVEDQQYGPCRWNFGVGAYMPTGKAYWVGSKGNVHYVKGLAR